MLKEFLPETLGNLGLGERLPGAGLARPRGLPARRVLNDPLEQALQATMVIGCEPILSGGHELCLRLAVGDKNRTPVGARFYDRN